MKEDRTALVGKIMIDFARLTGLDGGGEPRRYLWTDAFAACNFLELYRQTEDASWRELALRLVDQVHHVLGRHRPDDSRGGWISGLSDEEGERHPTRGGLRIGKRLNERRSGDPSDERMEWDRDGQYYHYLTKWMHALNRVGLVTRDAGYLRWAMELARTAHAHFCYAPFPGGAKRLHWKMSIDLSRPQVPSMGQHDPLDGLVTCCELRTAAEAFADSALPRLDTEIADLRGICRGKEWATDDALGIGGLLWDALRIAQLQAGFTDSDLLAEVLEAARLGLAMVSSSKVLDLNARYSLAFRELGLSIGLRGIEQLPAEARTDRAAAQLEGFTGYLPLADKIERFWLEGANQQRGSWQEHRDINMVMLATSLAPGQFLAAR